jgi:hypothetical protein
MILLGLVENVKGKLLKKVADVEWTQKDLEGINVSDILIIKKRFQWDVSVQPPNFSDCLAHLMKISEPVCPEHIV